jgi:conjugal transfer mating pair stabilization protein TraN
MTSPNYTEVLLSEPISARGVHLWKKALILIMIGVFLTVKILPAWAVPTYNPSTCSQTQADTCVDSTPCKSYGGITVCLAGVSAPPGAVSLTESCWKYSAQFQCQDTSFVDSCAPLIAKGCTQIGSQCQTDSNGQPMMSNGTCTTFAQNYQCPDQPSQTSQIQDCSNSSVCDSAGNCWSTGAVPDTDFANAVALMEAAREAGVYMDADGKIFSGTPETCGEGYLGIHHCCSDADGIKTNAVSLASTLRNMLMQAAWQEAKSAAISGSNYVYDFFFTDAAYAEDGAAAVAGGASTDAATTEIYDSAAESSTAATTTGASSGIGAFGITYGATAVEGVEAGTVISGAGTAGGPLVSLGEGFAFDPYSLAIMVCIMIIMKLMECSQEEAMLQMHKGAHLCHMVGSYCSKKHWSDGSGSDSSCVLTTQTYCCYNSLLAKIISEQGRPQIGKSYGTAQNPDCSGFTIPEIQQLDFSKIDLTEFTNSVAPTIQNMPNVPNIQESVGTRQQGRTSNSSQ